MAAIKLAFVHVGPPEGGIARYSRLLCEELKKNDAVELFECNLILQSQLISNIGKITAVAQKCSQADLVHVQFSLFNYTIWGSWWKQIIHLLIYFQSISIPVVATLHDVMIPDAETAFQKVKLKVRFWTLNYLLSTLDRGIVCTDAEFQQIQAIRTQQKLRIIPHFVEERTLGIDKETAQSLLDLKTHRVLTLLGFIYRKKGHMLLLEALKLLPEGYHVVFAGGPVPGPFGDQYLEEVKQQIATLGLTDRVLLTGYLSEEKLNHTIAATDLAICPFESFSASGSLSTWISATTPIVVTDLPQVHEYNRLSPGALLSFSPYTPEALAQRIQSYFELAESARQTITTQIEHLRTTLSISAIAADHIQLYRQVLNQ